MQLDHIQKMLQETVKDLRVQAEGLTDTRNIRLIKLKALRSAVQQLKRSDILIPSVSKVLSFDVIVDHVEDPVIVSQATGEAFINALSELRHRAEVLLQALDETLPKRPPETVIFKLPDTTSLQQASQDLNQLEKILNQLLVNDYLKGEAKLLSFDRGSLVVEIYVGTMIALMFLGGLVRLYYEAKQRRVKTDTQLAVLDDLVSEVGLRKKIREERFKLLEAATEADINTLIKNTKEISPDDLEYPSRVKNSFHMLGEMLERGAEVHPALTAPIEVQSEFPDPKKLLENIKLLSGSTVNDETSSSDPKTEEKDGESP